MAFQTYKIFTVIPLEKQKSVPYDQESIVIMPTKGSISDVYTSAYKAYEVYSTDSLRISKKDSLIKFSIKGKRISFYDTTSYEDVNNIVNKYLVSEKFDSFQITKNALSLLQTKKRDSTFTNLTMAANALYNKRKYMELKYDSILGYQYFISKEDNSLIRLSQFILFGLITLFGIYLFRTGFILVGGKIKETFSPKEMKQVNVTNKSSDDSQDLTDEQVDVTKDQKEEPREESEDEEITDSSEIENGIKQELLNKYNKRIEEKNDQISELEVKLAQINEKELNKSIENLSKDLDNKEKTIIKLEAYRNNILSTISALNKNKKDDVVLHLYTLLENFKINNSTIKSIKEYLSKSDSVFMLKDDLLKKINTANFNDVPSALDFTKIVIQSLEGTNLSPIESLNQIKNTYIKTNNDQKEEITSLNGKLKIKEEYITRIEKTNENFSNYWKNAKEKYYKSLRNDDLSFVKKNLFEMALHYYSLIAITNKKSPSEYDIINFDYIVQEQDAAVLKSKGNLFDIYESVQNSKVSNNIFKILVQGDEYKIENLNDVLVDGYVMDLKDV